MSLEFSMIFHHQPDVTSAKKPASEKPKYKKKEQTQPSKPNLFGDDDADLFGDTKSTPPIQTQPAKPPTKSQPPSKSQPPKSAPSLFASPDEEEEEDDLFGSKPPAKKETKKPPVTSSAAPSKSAAPSLFSGDDEDDLFGSAPTKIKPTQKEPVKPEPKQATKPAPKKSALVADPLFGGGDQASDQPYEH